MGTNAYYLNQFISTTLATVGGIDDSQTTGIILTSVTGVETTKPGIVCLSYSDPIDTSKAEWISYTSISVTNELQGVTRGAEGFSAKSHSNGVTIAFPISESHINNLNDALIIGGSATNLATGVIDDDTFATASATKLATSESIRNFVGSGWVSANETWTYASATTITVPSGAVSKYAIGDKIKLTQTTVKYFYIVGVADTLLTIMGGNDYTLTNATISDNYYSHQQSPIGFPSVLFYTPTYTPESGTYTSIRNLERYFSLNGGMVTVVCAFDGTCSGTPAYIDVALPVKCSQIELFEPGLVNGVAGIARIYEDYVRLSKIGGNWSTGAYSGGAFTISYLIK